jgi:tetratricopeptide (TPR) repeat protein
MKHTSAFRNFALCAALLSPAVVWSQAQSTFNNSSLTGESFYQILLAELAQIDGKPNETFSLYLDLARKTPSDQLFERAARLALDGRDGNAARQVAVEWARRLPESAEANNYLFQIYFGQGQYAAALPPLRAFLKLSTPSARPAIVQSLNSYFARPDDKSAATNELIRVLEPYLAEAYRTSEPATRQASQLAIARSQVNSGRYNDALAMLQILTLETPSAIDAWLLRGTLQMQENQFAGAETSFQQFLRLAKELGIPSSHAGYVQAYLNLAQLAEHRKEWDAAQNWLSKIEDDKERLTAQVRRASILAKQGRLEEARALIRELPEPTQAQARSKLLAEVQLLRDHKQIAEASSMMDKALAENPKDTGLMYELSTLYDKAKEYDKMEALLRRIIELEPNNQAAYNALGYSLADRGIRLDEAQKLIERALEITPNDPYIVDSLAWVFYRAGKLELALTTLQGAYKTRADAEIGAHIGEVLWMMGRKDEARQAWRDASIINADNETLLETLKRFDVKL